MKKVDVFEFIGKLLLVVFLCSTHTKLFYWLSPDYDSSNMSIPFSYLIVTENTVQAEIYGMLFGLMTVFVIDKRKNSPLYNMFVISIAILDGMVVQYLFNIELSRELKVWFASSHYSIYTIFIILMYGFAGKCNAKESANANANANESAKESANANANESANNDLQTYTRRSFSNVRLTEDDIQNIKEQMKKLDDEPMLHLKKTQFDNLQEAKEKFYKEEIEPMLSDSDSSDKAQRNYDIVKMLADNWKPKDIAAHFNISESTISRVLSKSKQINNINTN